MDLETITLNEGFPGSSAGKNPPATQEALFGFLAQEDPLEKGSTTHSSILGLPWWLSWQRICLQCRRLQFDPGLGRYPGEGIGYPVQYSWASLVAQTVKNLPATWETWVHSLAWEEPLEKGTTTHSSILAWRSPWTI